MAKGKFEHIAREAGTSIATVSRVLNNRGGVSEELRQRVRRVIDKHEFRPRMSRNRSTNLALVVHNESPVVESFTSCILEGISHYAFEQAVDTTMMFMPAQRAQTEEVLEKVREHGCDGMILFFPQCMMGELSKLAESGVPVMLINSRTDVEGIGYVENDSFGGSYDGTKHLIDLGHERIGFLCGPMKDSEDHNQRLAGFSKALAEAGLESNWVIPHVPTRRTAEAGYTQAKNLLNQDRSVTAIFASNDDMAFGAILACAEQGLRVPEDISIVGFDDVPGSKFFNPPLTTVRQPLHDLGYRAAKYTDAVQKGSLSELPRDILNTELIVRKSTAPVNRDRL